jgi:hypothetical protein
MSDRERCLRCELSPTPEVSIEALEELRTILAELPTLVTPTAIRTRRTSVRGEVRKDVEEKGGETQLELGLTRRVCWRELPEASQPQAIELLTQLLRLLAQVRPNDGRRAMNGSHKIASQHLTRPARVGAVQKRHPFTIRQRIGWNAKIDTSPAQVGNENTHYSIKT